jgi:hypothetical protein
MGKPKPKKTAIKYIVNIIIVTFLIIIGLYARYNLISHTSFNSPTKLGNGMAEWVTLSLVLKFSLCLTLVTYMVMVIINRYIFFKDIYIYFQGIYTESDTNTKSDTNTILDISTTYTTPASGNNTSLGNNGTRVL